MRSSIYDKVEETRKCQERRLEKANRTEPWVGHQLAKIKERAGIRGLGLPEVQTRQWQDAGDTECFLVRSRIRDFQAEKYIRLECLRKKNLLLV